MDVKRVCVCTLFGAALAASEVAAFSPVLAAVYSPQQALNAAVIKDFLNDPAVLLKEYPNGGAPMISRVRDLAASDPSTLNAIVGLLAYANAAQSTAIGTGLGQVALMAVKTDQAYANQIQEAIAGAVKGHDVGPVSAGTGSGSSLQNAGSAIKTINQVQGVTDQGEQALSPGSQVYVNEVIKTGASGKAELLFADRTNLAVGPVTTIRLDKFVYDPSSASGALEIEVGLGSFRFITGLQDKQNYKIKTAYATMGIRGTEFVVTTTSTGEQISVASGTVTVTVGTASYTVTAGQTLTVSAAGVVSGPTATPSNIQTEIADQFADLGTPTTGLTLADALSAFSAVTGTSATGATGGAGGGGGGTGGGGGAVSVGGFGGVGGGGGTSPSFTTYVVNTPSTTYSLSFTGATPGTTTTTSSVSSSVSKH